MESTGHKKIIELLLFCCLTCTFYTLCLSTNDNSCYCQNEKGGCDFTQQYDHSRRKENVALGKRATLSTVWLEILPACLAVNGNISRQFVGINESQPNCANSKDFENSTWELDLGREYDINSITVYTMDSYEVQMYGVLITIDDKFCYNITTAETLEVINITCDAHLRGQRVKFFKYAFSRFAKYLSFCEVQVWVCSKGWYGNDCNTPCSGHCSNNAICDRYDGSCPIGCISGWYGLKCNYSCPSYCGGACNQSTGACFDLPAT